MKVSKKLIKPFPAISIDNFIPSAAMVRSASKSFDKFKNEDWVIYKKDNGQVQYTSKIPRCSTPECLLLLDYIATSLDPCDYFDTDNLKVFPDCSHYGGGMMLTPNAENQGGYLGMHVDAPVHGKNKNWKREFSAVLCLSEEYDESFDLLVHNGFDCHDRLEYRFNRLNIFKCTENSWHGFPKISKGMNRKVLGLMFWSEINHKDKSSIKRIKAKFNNNLKFN